ncbi:MAG: efflux RND transporter permease subunit [Candidatus Krumholzibacteriota bacterium]|nr:efflux RND transporter permease subunit [Candidatus Krumholzibacteriota bacterium]
MKNIIRPFIQYPILGNVIIVAILLFGYVGFSSLNTTFFPPQPSRTIIINASYPGASPEEMEEGIVTKIEDNLKGISGIERTTSVSGENFCSIYIRVLTDYDTNIVLQDVKDAVNQISSFPLGMDRISIYRREPFNFAIDLMIIGDVDLKTLKWHGRQIERDLLSIEGISKISLSGFPAEEIEIAVSEEELRAYGLTFSEILSAVRNANIKSTGGKIKGEKEELLIRADVKGYHAEELANHVLKASDEGAVVRIGDVATVSDRWSENPNRIYYNGKTAVRVSVDNTNKEDLFFIADRVKEYAEKFNSTHSDVQALVLRDGSEIINERINLLLGNGLIGIVLVVLLLSLSLNPNISFWVALGIPISFAGMLMIAPFYGLTINVMSLMAMILILGILVDDGIVIAENIYQHHERGKKPVQAALIGTVEVLPSVIASVLTTVVIFMTFFFLEGGMGDHSRDLAFVVIATLLLSLIEAAFILPAHIAHSRALCVREKSRLERESTRMLGWVRDKIYMPVLRSSIKSPYISIATVLAIFIITIGAIRGGILKTTFFPYIEGRSVSINLEMPAGTPAAVTDSLTGYIEKGVWETDEKYKKSHRGENLVRSVYRRVGSGTHQGRVYAILESSEERNWTNLRAANEFREKIGKIKGSEKLSFGMSRRWGMPVMVALKSNNFEQLRGATEMLKEELKKMPQLKDVTDDDPPGLREVKVKLKEKAFALGLTTSEVVSQVRSGFFGGEAQRILRGIDEVKIWVRYSRDDRSSMSDLENMRIRAPGGQSYPLGEIADFSIERGVMSINHTDGQRVINVMSDVTSTKASVPTLLADIKENVMPEVKERYPEVRYSFEGESYENKKTMDAISRVVPAILIMMFLLIAVTFHSFGQAVIVFLLIPFSIVGVLWGHYIQGYIVSILSMFGAIALMGIVVNDSLVLVSTVNRKLKAGRSFDDSLFEAAISRFRPVVLTSLTTIAGLAPLVFEQSHQAQFLSPMAISVAYGLLFGTVLTLIMLPSMLKTFNDIKIKLYKTISGKEVNGRFVETAVREEEFLRRQNNDGHSNEKGCEK